MKWYKYIFNIEHLIIVALAYIQLAVLGVLTFNLDILNPVAEAFENFEMTDVFFEIEHSSEKSDTCNLITLVDMTELYSRRDIANLLTEISCCNPICMGVDLIFEGVKDDSIGNEALMESVCQINVTMVFSQKLTDYDAEKEMFTHSVRSFFVSNISVTEAFTNVNDNMQGARIRDFDMLENCNGQSVEAFPAKLNSLVNDNLSSDVLQNVLINYSNTVFRVVPYDSITEHYRDIENHIVLVGTMTEEQDMHATPIGKLPGLQIQAYSLLTLLEHHRIRVWPSFVIWLLSFVICYLLELTIDFFFQRVKKHNQSVFFVFLRESSVIGALILFGWIVLVLAGMFFAFAKKDVCIDGTVILALMALTCTARDLYKATIKALSVKNQSHFIQNSLLQDGD